jgi:hypothetical protein
MITFEQIRKNVPADGSDTICGADYGSGSGMKERFESWTRRRRRRVHFVDLRRHGAA